MIDDHTFDGYRYGDQVICVQPVGDPPRACGRLEADHAQVPEINPQGDTSTVYKATSS